LEVLEEKLKEGAKVLDVGSGTGYLTACFAIMVNIFKTSIKYNQAHY
jgi:protein-L-isoaspartate(D-aspartate) O-methyltransferase